MLLGFMVPMIALPRQFPCLKNALDTGSCVQNK